jgi:hypothetical protein
MKTAFRGRNQLKVLMVFLGAAGIFAQVNPSWAQAASGAMQTAYQNILDQTARFSVEATNKVFLDSTNLVHCKIQNISKSRITFFDNTGQALRSVNHRIPTMDLPKEAGVHTSIVLEPEQCHEWDEPMIINNDFKPGQYIYFVTTDVQIPALTNLYSFPNTSLCAVQGLELIRQP